MGKFVIRKMTDGEFRFNLKNNTNKIILTSESCGSISDCLNVIKYVRINSHLDSRFEKKEGMDGYFYFILKAYSGNIIAVSEKHALTTDLYFIQDWVKANAAAALIDDQIHYK